MNAFNNRYLINRKKCDIALGWMMLLIIGMLIFLNISINYKYQKYEQYTGYIKKIEDTFYLSIYIDNVNITKYHLLVNDLKYDFSINSISSGYYIIEGKNYYEVLLNVKLEDDLLIENNIVNVVFEKEATTLYKQFMKGLKKWLS